MQQNVLRPIIWLLVSLWGGQGATATAQFLPIEALERGMKGYGKTVFHGTTIDTFGVEILGVARKGLGPRRDLILARLSGGPLAETGIIAGMSGSPVYIEGQLVGAVAYGWAFSKAPICGITPIAEMLDVMTRPLDEVPEETPGRRSAATSAEPTSTLFAPSGLRGEHLQPLATPVSLSGLTPAAAAAIGDALAPFNLAVQTAPGGVVTTPERTLEPGAALGIQLIAGDMSATGIGTVTYRDGDRVVAFGHRMGLAGATNMPMTGALIHEVIPNQIVSFKLGASTRRIGAVRQDRAAAVAGQIGAAPVMVPVQVEIASPQRTNSFHFELLRHRELTPRLAAAVLIGSLESAEKLAGDATLELSASVLLGTGEQLSWNQVFSGPGAPFRAAQAAVAPLDLLTRTEVAEVELDSVSFAVDLREEVQTATIARVRVLASKLKPGARFQVEVVLQPYKGMRERVRLAFELPTALSPGPVQLRVGAGGSSRLWEQERRPDALRPRDLAQLLCELGAAARNDDLVVELYRADASLSVNGRELPGLPPSVRQVLSRESSSGHVGPVHGRVVLRKQLRTQYVLQGQQQLELEVSR